MLRRSVLALLLLWVAAAAVADPKKLRILTFDGYAPAELQEAFRRETGIEVEVILSGNEDMIARLKASGGAGYDLVEPSQDRVTGVQQSHHVYKPIDLSRVKMDQFVPDLFDVAKRMTSLDGRQYGLPFLWGAEGLVVNTRKADVRDYTDICKPEYQGKVAMRARRPAIIGFAFAMGKDPFALYANPKAYAQMLEEVGAKLMACRQNVRLLFDSATQVEDAMRNDEVYAGLLWDAPAWELNRDNPFVRFRNPTSGGLGWQMVFAIPAHAENEAGAYQWINFVMRPENAAKVVKAAGNFTSARGTLPFVDPRLKAQYAETFPDGLGNLHWYPPVPPGLEELEAPLLAKFKAAH